MPESGTGREQIISIHAPREGGDRRVFSGPLEAGISIHAPREGGDTSVIRRTEKVPEFQSTPPARGATQIWRKLLQDGDISIHAPREGGDVESCGN